LNHIGSREAQHTSVAELHRNPQRLTIVTGLEANMPLLFFLPMIIAAGFMPAPRTAKPVREDD
jgi:hypothetical protein